MEDDTRYYYSYKCLFRIQFKIYEVGGKVLPRAIPLDALAVTVIIYLPLFPLGWLLSRQNPWFMTLVLAAAGACTLSQFDPQGKFLPFFLKDLISYIFRHKTTNLEGRHIQRFRRHRLDWKIPEVVE